MARVGGASLVRRREGALECLIRADGAPVAVHAGMQRLPRCQLFLATCDHIVNLELRASPRAGCRDGYQVIEVSGTLVADVCLEDGQQDTARFKFAIGACHVAENVAAQHLKVEQVVGVVYEAHLVDMPVGDADIEGKGAGCMAHLGPPG